MQRGGSTAEKKRRKGKANLWSGGAFRAAGAFRAGQTRVASLSLPN